jgi:hypothetical protein
LLVLFIALLWFRRSVVKALIDLGALGLVTIGWLISKFATAVRRLGSIISVMSWIKGALGLYPGKEYIATLREEFVERGVQYHERGDVEIDDSAETLARETREAYNDAGRRLSNGEAALGLALAGVTLLPANVPSVPYSELLSSPAVGATLSVSLVIVVTLRLSALDMILYRDPAESEDLGRLAVYRDWNRAMMSGTEVVKTLLMFRVMRSINDAAFDFYVDWVFERNINGEGAGVLELLLELRRPIYVFNIAKRRGISPSQASRDICGWNVFSQFSFGPGADEPVPDEVLTSRLDSLLASLLVIKYELRDIQRIVRVHWLAENRDMDPEEVSKRLYGKNVVPESTDPSESQEESDE